MPPLFPGQGSNETIYMVIHEHWVRLALQVVVWLVLLLALVLFRVYMPQVVPAMFAAPYGQVVAVFEDVYSMFLLVSLFIIWTLYYLNIQIITNLRIVDVSQNGLFSRTISELHIDKIEDATCERKGLLETVFDYGMVYVQTAGAQERFEFSYVPNPNAIEKLVLDLYEKNSNFVKKEAAPASQTTEGSS